MAESKINNCPLRQYRVTIPRQTLLLNEYLKINKFQRPKLVAEWSWLLRAALTREGWRHGELPMLRSGITIERCSRSPNMDWDGLYGGVKPLLDALTRFHAKVNKYGLGVIHDDNVKALNPLVVVPRYHFVGDPYTIITITEMQS